MMIFNEQIVCVVRSCVFLLVSMFFEMFFICCCCCLYSPRCTRSLCFLKQINNMKKRRKTQRRRAIDSIIQSHSQSVALNLVSLSVVCSILTAAASINKQDIKHYRRHHRDNGA